MPTEKELLTGLLSKTLNLDEAGVAALYNADGALNDDALESVLKLDSERIAKLKPDTKKIFNDGYKKAQSEVAEKKEKAISEAVGFNTDLKGEEFDTALAEFVSTKATAGKDITDDVVKQHPVFKAREKELLKQVKEADEKATAKVEEITRATVRKETLAKVHAKAIAAIKDKALLPADEQKQIKQMKLLLLDPLAVYEYEFDGDEITGITKDGVRLEDKHGNALAFDDLILSTASDNGMEFKKVEPKGSANPKGGTPAPAKPVVMPKTQEEYTKFLADESIPSTQKTEVIQNWNKSVA